MNNKYRKKKKRTYWSAKNNNPFDGDPVSESSRRRRSVLADNPNGWFILSFRLTACYGQFALSAGSEP